MAQAQETAEGVWTAFRALPRTSREAFLERSVTDTAFREELEDFLDLTLARERADEPVRPLDEVLADLTQTHEGKGRGTLRNRAEEPS